MSKKEFKEKRKARRKEFGRGQKGKERAAAAKAKEIANRKMDEFVSSSNSPTPSSNDGASGKKKDAKIAAFNARIDAMKNDGKGINKEGAMMKSNQSGGGYAAKNPSAPAKQLARMGSSMYGKKKGPSMYGEKKGPSMYGKKHGSSMNASQDRSASMDDYSHEKKLKADGRYEAAHGKMANAKNDFDHAHALKKDAHYDAKGRHAIMKHMKGFK